ncbi:MAG: NAD(+)/NADH kinase [Candidatus Pacearchaeota archaeon]
MKALVVCKHEKNDNDDEVHKILESSGIEMAYAWKDALTKKEYDSIDFVISIGGDGTALSASHFLVDKPLLAVNSNPEKSVGALTTITLKELAVKLDEIKAGNFKTENLERMQIMINGNISDFLALNDVFIASEKAYNISKYKIRFKGVEEMQRSSGLIFSTGTGSTAWFKSAGGIPFSPQLKFIKMIIREPYCGKVACSLRLQGIEIKENEEIEVIPLVKSVLAIDSIREYTLNPNDIVKIKISNSPLRRIL